MYNQFYGFRENPFSLLPDPDFLYMSREHSAALNLLELAVLNHSGFCVISGEIGAGKTTILRELLKRLDDRVSVGMITNTHASFNDLMRWILAAFDLKAESEDGVVMHRKFTQFVTEKFQSGKHTLLIIDEAQNLSVPALEQLRMLSNINSGSDLLLQVVLVGQREIREKLSQPELEQFAQRISIDYFLKPLAESETTAYIEHRIAHAGGSNPLFDLNACARIYRYSGGIPRVINRLCDLSLVYGYAKNTSTIDASLIDAVVAEHKFSKSDMEEEAPAELAAPEATPVINEEKDVADSRVDISPRIEQTDAEPAATEDVVAKALAAKTVLAKAITLPASPVKAVLAEVVTAKTKAPAEAKSSSEAKTTGETEVAVEAETPASEMVLADERVSATTEEAMKRRLRSEQLVAEKTEHAQAALKVAAVKLAASKEAAASKLAAEQRLVEVVRTDDSASQLAATAQSAVETAVTEKAAAETDLLKKKKAADLATSKLKTEKTAAKKQIAEKLSVEDKAIKKALQATVAAEKALAEKLAAEQKATEVAAASSEARAAAEAETASRLAEVEQAAELALAEHDRASKTAVEKIANEKSASAHAEVCVVTAKEKATERTEVAKLTEAAIAAAKETQRAADASRSTADRAAYEQSDAEKEAVACATVEKVALASVAAEKLAAALKAVEMADAAKESALREAEQMKAAAVAAADFAAKAKAEAERAAIVAAGGTPKSVSEVQAKKVPLIEEPAMKELLLSDKPVSAADTEARRQNKSGRNWAVMALTAFVAGSAWFVIQPDDVTSDNSAFIAQPATSLHQSANAAVETAAMEIRGKASNPAK